MTRSVGFAMDVVCSWCPIGYYNLKRALQALSSEVDAKIELLPFELNPQMEREGEPVIDHLSRKYGQSEAQILGTRARLVALGSEVGVRFDFAKRERYYNTFSAHCLLHWAQSVGAGERIHEALIRAYFTDGVDVSDVEALLEVADAQGLDPSAARAAMESAENQLAVRNREVQMRALGITSVPTIVVDGKVILTGAQPTDAMIRVLREALT